MIIPNNNKQHKKFLFWEFWAHSSYLVKHYLIAWFGWAFELLKNSLDRGSKSELKGIPEPSEIGSKMLYLSMYVIF